MSSDISFNPENITENLGKLKKKVLSMKNETVKLGNGSSEKYYNLDDIGPVNDILNISANKSRAELAHKGALSERNKPSRISSSLDSDIFPLQNKHSEYD